ncbi:MAG: IS110 family transposase [Bacteroidia bacterium]
MEAFVGLDISKGYADVLLTDSGGRELDGVIQLDDTLQGHEALADWCGDMVRRFRLTRVYCGLESTGGLENNWHAMLVRLGATLPIQVARINPRMVRDSAKAANSQNVTDAASASHIAGYIRRFRDKVDFSVQDTRYSSFRSLNNHIMMMNKQKTMLVNEAKQLLYSAFPELLPHCRNGIPNWAIRLLSLYPSAAKLGRARAQTVAKIKGITPGKAKALVESAKKSVASRDNGTNEFLVAAIVEDIARKQERIKSLKDHLASHCTGREVDLLKSIVGVAGYSAAAIMAEIEDIARFPSPSQLAAYFGLPPRIKESGDKKGKSVMSKKGRPMIRAVLYMCASTAVIRDAHMKAIYTRHRENGKTHKQAVGVVMHKLLRVIWGILTSRRPYDPRIDEANQKRNPQEAPQQDAMQSRAKRRVQDFDPNAPISGKARKQRKALVTSQSGKAEEARDHARAPTV